MDVEAFLDIDQVNQMTGLPQATLRNWEKRYGFPRPQRTTGGHRIYSMDEVKRIRQVAAFCRDGIKLKEAIEKVLNDFGCCELEAVKPAFSPLAEEVTQILQALYRYDEGTAEKVLSKVGLRLSEVDLLQLVYTRCLVQVGTDWEDGRINVAQEHFGWNFFRTRLLNYFKSSQITGQQPKFVLATPSGQLHEGGLMILAGLMMQKGWRVYYLGANLPFEDLKHAVDTIRPDAICLSAVDEQSILKDWAELATLGCSVFVGGPCVMGLKESATPSLAPVHLMEGDLPTAVENIELVVYSNFRTKER